MSAVSRSAALRAHADRFRAQLVTDLMAEATAGYWNRRAEDLLAARPRQGDFRGRSTDAELRAQWDQLTAIAQACRARAQVSMVEELPEDVVAMLREVA